MDTAHPLCTHQPDVQLYIPALHILSVYLRFRSLLIYLALVNFRDIKNAPGRRRKGGDGYDGRLPATVCAWGLLCGLVLMGGVMYSKSKYAVLYHRHHEEAAQAQDLLDQILRMPL